MALQNRLLFWSVIALSLLALGFWAFSPRPIDVDIVQARQTEMSVFVREEGETRIHDVFEISAPVAGQLERIRLEAGDCVYAEQTVVATIRPISPGIIDSRTRAQLEAAESASEAAVSASVAELEQVRAELTRAQADAERYRTLAQSGAIARQTLERAETDAAALRAGERASEAALAMRRQELAAARAALRPSSTDAGGELVAVIAPIDGLVLRRLRQSEGPVAQGASLVEIGDPEEMEIIADLLSEDAVSISPGDEVIVSDWGGLDLTGVVRRVEPFAFTKISALGIEEQRVNVVIDLLPGQPAGRLGHGYRVDVAIRTWSGDDVLTAPMTALFKQGGDWSVYRVENGRARLRTIAVGHLNGATAEILAGLEPGDRLVEHPSNRVENGIRVRPRAEVRKPATDPSAQRNEASVLAEGQTLAACSRIPQ